MSDVSAEQPGFVPSEAINPPTTLPASRLESSLPVKPFAEKYKAQAEARGIKPVEGGEWLTVDGVEYIQWGDEKRQFVSNSDEQTFPTRLNQVGTYDSNNGTLAFVDEKGVMHAGHSTGENFQALEQAGYRGGGIWVPFSNGEVPTDPVLRQKYVELREKGREANKRETTARHLKMYQEIGEKKDIKEVEGGMFMMVDGIEYRHFGNETGQVDVNTDGYSMPIRRVDQVGTYNSNNGTMAFVDGQGRMWVGASTQENFDAIRKAGYRQGGIWVPFSNLDHPTDKATYEKLRDVLTGKPADQLRAERTARVEEIIEIRQQLFGEAAHPLDRDQLYAKVADRQETEHINSNEQIALRLNARTETDDEGFERRIYIANGVSFAFRGREELPTYSTMSKSKTQLLGDVPQWVSLEDYQAYQAQVAGTQKQENAQQHYLASKTLLGVVDLAIQFGSKDLSLQQLREELPKGIYSPKALVLVDALVASSYVDDAGYQIEARANIDAEALVLAALLGDSQSQTAVAQKVEALRHLEQQAKVDTERRTTDTEALRPQELVAVHATKYEPQVGPDGELLVQTTFDATKGKVLRNSIHTALNHKVAGHMYGSWGDAGYVLISPFESMMQANGVPTILNTVDTWWSRDPGEPLSFPDATIVKPGGSEVLGLFEIDGRTIKFKSEGLEQQDLRALADYIGEHGDLDRFMGDIDSSFLRSLSLYGPLEAKWDTNNLTAIFGKFLFGQEQWIFGDNALFRELTTVIEGHTEHTLEQRVRKLVEDSGAIHGLKPEVQDQEAAIVDLVNDVVNNIRGQMFSEINKLAVKEAIKSRGYDIHSGGMWAWDHDSRQATGQTAALGEQLGVPVTAHSNTSQFLLTDRFSRTIGAAYKGEEGSAKFEWTKYNPNYDELVPQIDPKTRRVLYASGLLTSRI